MPPLAERFMALFDSYKGSHGTYKQLDAATATGKRPINSTATTQLQPYTLAMWQQHLAGTRPLGLVPIREDATVVWSAIDVDEYSLDHTELIAKLDRDGVPAIVCKTKSGGAHLYFFFSEPVPAAVCIAKLREVAAFLGYANSEIFPKQAEINAQRSEAGSWLNMPYFGGDHTERYAIRPNGTGYSASGFLAHVEHCRVSLATFQNLKTHPTAEGFSSGPPCLETLVSTGFPDGTRNNGLLALGVLAKKLQPGNWEQLLIEWNQKHMVPPLPHNEVESALRSLRRKDYNYRCRDVPLVGHCNSMVCRTRPHGVGRGAGGLDLIESISIYDTFPPTFYVTLKTGNTVDAKAEDVVSFRRFQTLVLQQCGNVLLPMCKDGDWQSEFQAKLKEAPRVVAPEDSTKYSEFLEHLEQFCVDRHHGERREDLLAGKPWHDNDTQCIYFRLRDLQAVLERDKVKESTRETITAKLRDLQLENRQFKVGSKVVRAWVVPYGKFGWVAATLPAPSMDSHPL